jgi:hypothetical protein
MIWPTICTKGGSNVVANLFIYFIFLFFEFSFVSIDYECNRHISLEKSIPNFFPLLRPRENSPFARLISPAISSSSSFVRASRFNAQPYHWQSHSCALLFFIAWESIFILHHICPLSLDRSFLPRIISTVPCKVEAWFGSKTLRRCSETPFDSLPWEYLTSKFKSSSSCEQFSTT